jgi:hypothetical protein
MFIENREGAQENSFLDMVAYACNSSIQVVEAGGL